MDKIMKNKGVNKMGKQVEEKRGRNAEILAFQNKGNFPPIYLFSHFLIIKFLSKEIINQQLLMYLCVVGSN